MAKVTQPSEKTSANERITAPMPSALLSRGSGDSDAYLERLRRLFRDKRTNVYFDTSFLMWVARLGQDARTQFLLWETESEGFWHVPLWSAHEFYKHMVNDKIVKDFKKEMENFEKTTSNFYSTMRTAASDALFGFRGGGSLFIGEYRRTVQSLRTMLGFAVNHGIGEIKHGADEVAAFIDRRLMHGPLQEVLDGIEEDERIRQRGAVPPSFKDAHKRNPRQTEMDALETATRGGDNSFGDLVFWREVLRHAGDQKRAAYVVATADRKNDWFVNYHGSSGVAHELKARLVELRPVPMAHPLLIRESSDRNAGEPILMDPVFCGALLQSHGAKFAALTTASLDAKLPRIGKIGSPWTWANRMGQDARPPASYLPEDDEASAAATSDVTDDTMPIDPELFGTKLEECSRKAATLIEAFEAANAAARNEILSAIAWVDLDRWNSHDLIVLGRTIGYHADRGDHAADAFLANYADCAVTLPPEVTLPLYFGAMGSLYFDDRLRRRPPSGSPLTTKLLDLVTLKGLLPAAAALGQLLKRATPRPYYLPGSMKKIRLTVETQSSADNKSPADLLAIRLDEIDLTVEIQDEKPLRFATILGIEGSSRDVCVGDLVEILTRFHLLPRQLISVDRELKSFVKIAEFAGVELDP